MAQDATAEKILNPFDNNPVKTRIKEVVVNAFNGEVHPMGEVEDYEFIDAGKWEIHVKVRPKADSATRLFKIKISEQL